jgi:hypothetical protein
MGEEELTAMGRALTARTFGDTGRHRERRRFSWLPMRAGFVTGHCLHVNGGGYLA